MKSPSVRLRQLNWLSLYYYFLFFANRILLIYAIFEVLAMKFLVAEMTFEGRSRVVKVIGNGAIWYNTHDTSIVTTSVFYRFRDNALELQAIRDSQDRDISSNTTVKRTYHHCLSLIVSLLYCGNIEQPMWLFILNDSVARFLCDSWASCTHCNAKFSAAM